MKKFKIILFRGDWNFAVILEKTRKDAERKEREFRQEMKTWAASEPKPNASQRGWVHV